jgi:hypothetical protein
MRIEIIHDDHKSVIRLKYGDEISDIDLKNVAFVSHKQTDGSLAIRSLGQCLYFTNVENAEEIANLIFRRKNYNRWRR